MEEEEGGGKGDTPPPLLVLALEVIFYLNEKLRGIAGDHVIHH